MSFAPSRPRFEVADVVRAHEGEYRRKHFVTVAQAKALRHIASCRTAAMGGHVDTCTSCRHERISYNSCRDRHCPKCQATERAKWLERRLEHLLPVPYFHVVFTVPRELNALMLGNKAMLYALLLRTAARTLQEIATDPDRLGAEVGFTSVLHTWGQNLLFHPHVHCVVTGGGLSPDRSQWRPARSDYLLPVRVLSRLFRGKLLAALQSLWRTGELQFGGSTVELADASVWAALRDRLYRKDWVVYAKRPFGGPEHVYRYLGRYTHRIALSNHRIVGLGDHRVSFSWRDYADGGTRKVMTLDAMEFLRRFLLHVLPKGFVRIRHYGLHAPRNVGDKLATARWLLTGELAAVAEPSSTESSRPWWEAYLARTGVDVMACEHCGVGRYVRCPLPASAARTTTDARAPPRAS